MEAERLDPMGDRHAGLGADVGHDEGLQGATATLTDLRESWAVGLVGVIVEFNVARSEIGRCGDTIG